MPAVLPGRRRAACLALLIGSALSITGLVAPSAGATTATYCHTTHTSIIGPGESLTYAGMITSTTGVVVPGVDAHLDVWGGSAWKAYLHATTNSAGRVNFTIAPGTTNTYRISYIGSPAWSACVSTNTVIWLSNDSRVVAAAASHNGQPYQYGAAGPDSFDCSGLMLYVLSPFGRLLPHNSQLQYNSVRHISTSSLQQGDLVFFGSSTSGIYHVGMYAGGGYIWHAPGDGQTVKKEKIWTSAYYAGRL